MYKLFKSLQFLSLLSVTAHAWLAKNDNGTIRGVNLGGLFIIEPWMMSGEWQTMGCGPYRSEFDCVMNIGQAAADAAFQHHWSTWITAADFAEMASYGINTVRIPLGYWLKEDIVYADSEHFPRGGWQYLVNVVGYAKQYGINVLLDLHGAPGAQIAQQPFTGQYAPTAGFFVDWQYARAYKFLEYVANQIHTNPAFSTVFGLELVNEPLAWQPSITSSLCSSYYPTAYKTIRNVEAQLKVPTDKRIHISMMNNAWGSCDPLSASGQVSGGYGNLVLDDHHYVKWTPSVNPTKDAYMQHSCTDVRSSPADQGNALVVGEWSLSVADNSENSPEFTTSDPNNVNWYKQWFAAQVMSYEDSGKGWIFWSWKQTLGDWRWGYQAAVRAGVIPKDLSNVRNMGAQYCGSYRKTKRGVGTGSEEIASAVNTDIKRRRRHEHHLRRHNHHMSSHS